MTTRSEYPPVRGQSFTLYFEIPKDDGTVVLNPAGLVVVAVADGRALPIRGPRVMDTSTGSCRAVLPADVMQAAVIQVTATATDAGALPYTEKIHTAAQTLDTMHSRSGRQKGWR